MSKEDVLSRGELDAFDSEQKAAIDCLVLTESSKFIGHSISSMSYLVQELRTLKGHPQETNLLIGEPMYKPFLDKTLAVKDYHSPWWSH